MLTENHVNSTATDQYLIGKGVYMYKQFKLLICLCKICSMSTLQIDTLCRIRKRGCLLVYHSSKSNSMWLALRGLWLMYRLKLGIELYTVIHVTV